MILSLITNQVNLAKEADVFGIDRIMIDLEQKGKESRQSGLGLFLSDHRLEDLPVVKNILSNALLMVRVNAPEKLTQEEIDSVIEYGADYVMLPYFHHLDEVHRFTDQIAGRCKISLLVETAEAADNLMDFSELSSIDEIHIGLNDLSLSRNYKSIFEPLYTGEIEKLCRILKESGKPYGFGGIGKLSNTTLPVNPVRILAEQVRLGCSIGWLGRTFRNDMSPDQLKIEIKMIRDEISKWKKASPEEFRHNADTLYTEIRAWEEKLLTPEKNIK